MYNSDIETKGLDMNRDFKGIWIPKEIYLDNRLGAMDKIVFAEIWSLDCGDGCYASNEYLASFCQCTQRNVQGIINKLKDMGLVEQVKFDGRTRWLKCKIGVICGEKVHSRGEKNFVSDMNNVRGRGEKNFVSGMKKNSPLLYNIEEKKNKNINNNILSSNKLDKSEILSLWNRLAEKWGLSKINIVSDERQQKIIARLKDSGCESLYEMFKRIDEAIMGSIFLRGKKQRWMNGEWVLDNADWRPDFDFFTQKSKFIKAIDGGYDDKDVIEKKNEGKWEQYKNWMNKNWGEF